MGPAMFRIFNTVIKSILGCALALVSFIPVGGAEANRKETTLYSFCAQSSCADGSIPTAGLIMDSAGSLYGTTFYGGNTGCGDGFGCGTVFKLSSNGSETVLHIFTGGNDGERSTAGLIMDSVGNLYGTTQYGGGTGCGGIGCGTVFEMAPDGTETVLYSFCSAANCADGVNPEAGVIMDNSGNLYGTTNGGGTNCKCGTVFKLATDRTETVLHGFNGGSDGDVPFAGVIMDSAGNLYGTTYYGGSGTGCPNRRGCGTAFMLAPDGTKTVLYAFCSQANCVDGAWPYAGLIIDSSGNLYGTTERGGINGIHCCGVVFRIAPGGTETVLHAFARGRSDGRFPYGALIADQAGNLYGTTSEGGKADDGTVFEVATDGTETVLHSFTGYPTDGSTPHAGAIMDSAGNLYGTTDIGGVTGCAGSGCGTVFRIKP